MFRRTMIGSTFVFAIVTLLNCGYGQDAFYQIASRELHLTAGKFPDPQPAEGRPWDPTMEAQAYGVLDGPGEIYIESDSANAFARAIETVSVRAPAGKDVTGRLFVLQPDKPGMTEVRFTIPASAATRDAKTGFYSARNAHYQRLLDQGVPGGAWFRYQVRKSREELKLGNAAPQPGGPLIGQRSVTEVDDTYGLFTGERAMSENLQLDRALPPLRQGDPAPVELSAIKGVTGRRV